MSCCLGFGIVEENRILGEQSKGESVMKGDRRNRIDELKMIQNQKQFIQMLESRNYPSYQLLATNADEEIWNKAKRYLTDEILELLGELDSSIEDVYIDEQYLDPDMAEAVRNGFKEAFKDYQKKLQKDMQQDINMDDIKRLLGK